MDDQTINYRAVIFLASHRLSSQERREFKDDLISTELSIQEKTTSLKRVLKERVSDFGKLYKKSMERVVLFEELNLSMLIISDPEYPERLKSIYDPPLFLLLRGTVSSAIFVKPSVAIVGSRRCDEEGCGFAREFGVELARQGITVVSGLALGIDTCAHTGALESGERESTIGVLGSGFNRFYPSDNRTLAERITEDGGLIISQFDVDTIPFPSNFLNRNRVIAGLSNAVIVVQATARSGSLATARYAIEENRDVLVLPGSISDPRYEGSLSLLKQGAYLVSTIDDVLEVIGVPNKIKRQKNSNKEVVKQPLSKLVEFLSHSKTTSLDEIKRALGESVDIETELLKLELEGTIRAEPGMRLSLVKRINGRE